MGMWSRRTFPFIFWGLWAATVIGRSGALLLIAALVTVSYIVSLVIHPRARCLRCDGTGEAAGTVYGWAHRRCPQLPRAGSSASGPPAGLGHVRGQARQNRRTPRRHAGTSGGEPESIAGPPAAGRVRGAWITGQGFRPAGVLLAGDPGVLPDVRLAGLTSTLTRLHNVVKR